MRKKYLLLGLIILIAAFFRFWQLGQNPPSLTWDEAAWGYNAYSLGIDGKDEFGRFLPLNYLESFGDFKPPMYAYLDIVPVKLLGLNEFAVRFPSALSGVLAVLVTYFLVKRIFWNSKSKEAYALFSTLFLAISPWHIMLSRAAFEANVASLFIIFGIYAFLEGALNRKWFLTLSAISFALSFYVFNTARVVSPILVIFLLAVFWKNLWKIKKIAIFSALVGLLVLLPTLGFLLTPQASLRFKEVNIFSDTSVVTTSNQEIANDSDIWWSKVIHNRRFFYGLEYLKHYFDNFNPGFLFITGDHNPKFSSQAVGQMYVWDIIFFISGILILIRKKEGYWMIVPLWLLIGIIPAALARETPHALRIESSLPTFQILTAYGFVNILTWIKKLNLRFKTYDLRGYSYILILASYILLSLNVLYFFHDYHANYKYQYSGEWQYGYRQSIEYAKSVEDNYDFIQVSKNLGRAYIYHLFYTRVDPSYFRQTANISRDIFGFVAVDSIGKYLFPQNFNQNLSATKKVLYLDNLKNLPDKAREMKRFQILNEEDAFIAYTM